MASHRRITAQRRCCGVVLLVDERLPVIALRDLAGVFIECLGRDKLDRNHSGKGCRNHNLAGSEMWAVPTYDNLSTTMYFTDKFYQPGW